MHRSEQTSTGEAFDEAVPARLLRQGGERLLRAVACAFVDRFDERAAELERALEAADLEQAGRIAHGLRSSCELVGAARLGRLCGVIESHADADALPQARDAARPLRSVFEEVRPWVEAHTGR